MAFFILRLRQMKKIWKQIPEFPSYFVSRDGRVVSLQGNEPLILKQQTRLKGYKCLDLRENGKSMKIDVHRLVLMAFVGMPEKGMECDHINGIRDDNRLENLRWVTKIENEANKKRLKKIRIKNKFKMKQHL
jgi:hypothetical protein